MIYLLVLLPATALTIGGYFALFLSGRSEGRMRTFGRYLGYWAFLLAALLVLGGCSLPFITVINAPCGCTACTGKRVSLRATSGVRPDAPSAPAAPPEAPRG